MIATLPTSETMFASRARTESADTRWTSLMSLLIRETMSPIRVFA